MNTIKTFFLLTVLTGMLMLIGALRGGISGVIGALVFSVAINFAIYWWSDKIALRMTHAKEVSPEEDPELHSIVEEQSRHAYIHKPRVYVIENDSPNAFATGRSPKHGAMAVTTGIRQLLTREELSGVIAHELAHIGNRDTLIMTIVAAMAGAIMWIAMIARWSMIFGGVGGRGGGRSGRSSIVGIGSLLIMAIVMPIAATIIRLAISQAREYKADATGAKASGKPWALANALEKLGARVSSHPMQVNEAASHLFIVHPFKGGISASLFSTHPPIKDRVRRLRNTYTIG